MGGSVVIRVSGPRIPTRREQVLVLLAAALIALVWLMVSADPAADTTPEVTVATAPGASAVPYLEEP